MTRLNLEAAVMCVMSIAEDLVKNKTGTLDRTNWLNDISPAIIKLKGFVELVYNRVLLFMTFLQVKVSTTGCCSSWPIQVKVSTKGCCSSWPFYRSRSVQQGAALHDLSTGQGQYNRVLLFMTFLQVKVSTTGCCSSWPSYRSRSVQQGAALHDLSTGPGQYNRVLLFMTFLQVKVSDQGER